MNRRICYAVIAAGALALAGCSKAPTEDVIATVNGESISQKEYITYLERKPTVQVLAQGPGQQDAQVLNMLGLQALRDLINRRLTLQLAKDEGVMPSKAEVDKEIDFLTEQRGNFIQALTAQGISLETIKGDIQVSLAREGIVTKGIVVPMREVETYIKENPKEFMEPARATVMYVVLNDATKRKLVDDDLASGQAFQTVAVRYSDDPGVRQSGAMYQTEVIDQMPEPVKVVVEKAPLQKATPWQQFGAQWVRFYVQKRTPAKAMEMTENRKRAVQRSFAQQRGSAAIDFNKRLLDKLSAAKIDVKPRHLREPWNKAMEQIKTEMAQANTGSGTAAPTTPEKSDGKAPQ